MSQIEYLQSLTIFVSKAVFGAIGPDRGKLYPLANMATENPPYTSMISLRQWRHPIL